MKSLIFSIAMLLAVSAEASLKGQLLAECRTSTTSVSVTKENGRMVLKQKNKPAVAVHRFDKGHYISYANMEKGVSLSVYANCFTRSGLCGNARLGGKSRDMWCLNGRDVTGLTDQVADAGASGF